MSKGNKEKYDEIMDHKAEVASLIVREQYNKFMPNFIRTLRLSRLPFLKRVPLYVNGIQIGMVSALSKLQNAVLEGKGRLKKEKNKDEIESLEKGMFINKQLIRVWQTIADGIAWRTLKFNRPVLRLLSENQSPGFIKQYEVPIYEKYLRKARHILLVNDLTRYLRIGDMTMVSSDGSLWIYEMKKSGRKLKDVKNILSEMKNHSRWFSKQEMRQYIAQTAVIEQKISVPIFHEGKIKKEIKAEIVSLDFEIKNHFNKVKRLIRKANKVGYGSGLLEEGYYVVVTAFDLLIQDERKRKKWKEKEMPTWTTEGKNVVRLSTYDSFFQEEGHFPRNFTPYSVFPFKASECVRMMMGHLEISIFFDLNILGKRLDEVGWVIEDKDLNEKINRYKTDERIQRPGENIENFFDSPVEEELWLLSRRDPSGDIYYQSLVFTYLLIILSSYYQTDVILRTLEKQYENSKLEKRKRDFTINLLREKDVLI